MLRKYAQVYSVPKINEGKALLGIYLCKCCDNFYAGGKEVAHISWFENEVARPTHGR